MTFTELPNDFKFEDRYEVAFERVKISPEINYATKIVVENTNSSIDPVFRLEESEFPGVEDVTSSDINENKFILEITNAQFAYNGDEELCNYDYKGDIMIKRNNFGHLRDKNFFIRGAQAFKFENNAIDTINGQAFELDNVENIHMIANQFGFALRVPVVYMYYKDDRSGCDNKDLPENKIGKTIIKHNKFSKLLGRFFDLDEDPNYKDFVKNKFSVSDNEVAKRCNCTNTRLSEDADDNERIAKLIQDSSKCLSDQTPPLLGN